MLVKALILKGFGSRNLLVTVVCHTLVRIVRNEWTHVSWRRI